LGAWQATLAGQAPEREGPRGEPEPTKYWVSTLPQKTKLPYLVKVAKQRWIIERDYEELKQELGLGHYEGRNWRGFHHHAPLSIAAYGFLVMERNRFSPQRASVIRDYQSRRDRPALNRETRRVRPERHNPHSIATLRIATAKFSPASSGPYPAGTSNSAILRTMAPKSRGEIYSDGVLPKSVITAMGRRACPLWTTGAMAAWTITSAAKSRPSYVTATGSTTRSIAPSSRCPWAPITATATCTL
jgi:hypothetical protein